MERRNWPWRKKSNSNTGFIMSSNSAVDGENPNSSSVSSSSKTSPFVEMCTDKTALLLLAEKKKNLSLLENAKAFEALAWKEEAGQKAKVLELDDAEKHLVSKDAMVKQHAKVAEEAVSGWEKAEVEALSFKQQLVTSMQQRSLLEGRVKELEEALKSSMTHTAELEEALKSSLKQLRQTQEEQQQRTKETIDRKLQEWGNVKAEMEETEQDLRQRMLAAEAQSCAMAKSLEERARAITELQEGKGRAEMEAGLLQVKLESQATEMTALGYELRVLTKELEIRNKENESSRKVADSAHRQHLEDVKKITQLDSECQRLRNLVRRKLPGPSAIAQMKMEAEKADQSKRRRSLGSNENPNSCQGLSEKLRTMEEETNTLRETLAKRSAELTSVRLMCARTANKLSVAEEQLESLQGTPTSVRSTQNSTLESFLLRSQAIGEVKSERLDDEVSCAESWASALITELAQFKKLKQSTDLCAMDSSSERFVESPKKPLKDGSSNDMPTLGATHGSPSPQDFSTLRTLAGKDAQLQSANLMCKDAMAKLASAEAKLGETWISENPRSNVEESVNSVGEAHGIMSKLDRILDDMRIAAASIGDMTDDDSSENGMPILSPPAKGTRVAPSVDLHSLKDQKEKQDKAIDEIRMQVNVLEATKIDLQIQLHAKEDELKQVRCEMEDAHMQIEELNALQLNSKCQQEKLLAEKEAQSGEMQAQLEAKQNEVSKLEAKNEEMQAQLEAKQNEVSKLQNSVASLGAELADQHKKQEASIAKCAELDKKLQSYVEKEYNMATSCRFEEESELRGKKEREMAIAKEKLAECQRTILVLGKQLTAFTSASSASFDSTMPVQYGPLDTSQYQEVDHAHKMRARSHQRRSLPYNSVNPHDDGTNCSSTYNSNTHMADTMKRPPYANGGQYSKPRRIHSDLSYRTGSTNPVPGMSYSVAEHLQMDDGVSSFYDSRTESAMSSPSSQCTSPNDVIRMQRSRYEGPVGSGVRTSLAKSLEGVVDGKSSEGGGNGRAGMGRTSMVRVVASTTKNGSNGGGGGKASKSLSRFFGRSKK